MGRSSMEVTFRFVIFAAAFCALFSAALGTGEAVWADSKTAESFLGSFKNLLSGCGVFANEQMDGVSSVCSSILDSMLRMENSENAANSKCQALNVAFASGLAGIVVVDDGRMPMSEKVRAITDSIAGACQQVIGMVDNGFIEEIRNLIFTCLDASSNGPQNYAMSNVGGNDAGLAVDLNGRISDADQRVTETDRESGPQLTGVADFDPGYGSDIISILNRKDMNPNSDVRLGMAPNVAIGSGLLGRDNVQVRRQNYVPVNSGVGSKDLLGAGLVGSYAPVGSTANSEVNLPVGLNSNPKNTANSALGTSPSLNLDYGRNLKPVNRINSGLETYPVNSINEGDGVRKIIGSSGLMNPFYDAVQGLGASGTFGLMSEVDKGNRSGGQRRNGINVGNGLDMILNDQTSDSNGDPALVGADIGNRKGSWYRMQPGFRRNNGLGLVPNVQIPGSNGNDNLIRRFGNGSGRQGIGTGVGNGLDAVPNIQTLDRNGNGWNTVGVDIANRNGPRYGMQPEFRKDESRGRLVQNVPVLAANGNADLIRGNGNGRQGIKTSIFDGLDAVPNVRALDSNVNRGLVGVDSGNRNDPWGGYRMQPGLKKYDGIGLGLMPNARTNDKDGLTRRSSNGNEQNSIYGYDELPSVLGNDGNVLGIVPDVNAGLARGIPLFDSTAKKGKNTDVLNENSLSLTGLNIPLGSKNLYSDVGSGVNPISGATDFRKLLKPRFKKGKHPNYGKGLKPKTGLDVGIPGDITKGNFANDESRLIDPNISGLDASSIYSDDATNFGVGTPPDIGGTGLLLDTGIGPNPGVGSDSGATDGARRYGGRKLKGRRRRPSAEKRSSLGLLTDLKTDIDLGLESDAGSVIGADAAVPDKDVNVTKNISDGVIDGLATKPDISSALLPILNKLCSPPAASDVSSVVTGLISNAGSVDIFSLPPAISKLASKIQAAFPELSPSDVLNQVFLEIVTALIYILESASVGDNINTQSVPAKARFVASLLGTIVE